MIYHPNSKQIIGLDISNGSQHDIKLARKTVKKFKHCEYVMTDLGYYGLEQDGFKLLMPIKEKKNFPLFKVEKKYNKMIGKIRVVIEHINSQLKTFRILSERYRNRRKRFGLRVNLIAALVLLLILSKLIWENTVGSLGTAELIGSPVLVEAHLLGVIWGIIFALAYIIWAYCIDPY